MPKLQPVREAGAVGRYRPKLEVAPALRSMVSAGVGTHSHPDKTLKASDQITDFEPAPSADAAIPLTPAAPVVPPEISEAGSASLSLLGVFAVIVGMPPVCVTSCTRCCAETVLPDCETQARRISMEAVAPGIKKASVVA